MTLEPSRRTSFTAKHAAELDYWIGLRDELEPDAVTGVAPLTTATFARYCDLFDVGTNSFADRIVLDVGCGPAGSLHLFRAQAKFGVDVLARHYSILPIAGHDIVYIGAPAEDMPFVDGFADVVLTANALDHVGSFEGALAEIHRVRRPRGQFLAEVNMRDRPTLTEPHVIDEGRLGRALEGYFDWTVVRRIPRGCGDRFDRVVIAAVALDAQHSDILAQARAIVEYSTGTDLGFVSRRAHYAGHCGADRAMVAEYSVAAGFEHFFRGEWNESRDRMWAAVRSEPRWLTNRGVLSVLVRSSFRPRRRGGSAP